jgi:phage-related baseplate assembly protein
LQEYAEACHRLEGRVDPSWIDYMLHSVGAVQLQILEPQAPIVTTAFQAPYCTGVEVEVETL